MPQATKGFIVVLVTAKDIREARKISDGLLARHLVACANIVKPVDSFFWWQGKIDKAKEVLLILKTRRDLFKRVIKEVRSRHSYSVPEILALPILDGNADYLKWIDASVNRRDPATR